MVPSVVVVGVSLGGFSALRGLLSALSAEFRPPILIVQHRGKFPGDTLVDLLAAASALPVTEATDKEGLALRHVYLAPSDYHLLVEAGGVLALSTDTPVNHARPSIDVLFESAADVYGPGVLAVVLTGLNDDGARGCARIKQRGGRVVVEDPATAESPQMPSAAIAATTVDKILPLTELPAYLTDLCRPPAR
jgi:two-component system, chemotaxis family, protein-glutamate methylesterase/glutaminase